MPLLIKQPMPKYFYCIILFLTVCFSAYNQIESNQLSDVVLKYKKSADKHFNRKDYVVAMKEYATIIQYYINDPEVNYKYGVCILYANYHKEMAIPFFETAIKAGNVEAIKMLGLTYHEMYKFEEALKYYHVYTLKSDTNSNKYKKSNIKKLISNVLTAIDMVDNPVDVTIENVGHNINSEFADYVPIVTADDQEIFFTSRRPSSTGGDIDHDSEYFEDIFYSDKDSLGRWMPSRHISGDLNSHHHDAVAGLSADGQTLIIYQNDLYGHGGDLLVSYLRDTVWTKPKMLSEQISLKDSWEPSASLTANEDAIYFSSDRPGGYGGLDLYVSKRLPSGQYGDPVNLGAEINTEEDEDSPFISADSKTLYFSSKGHRNMGGYDVFKSEKDVSGKWSKPENMGYPINTTDDDIFFTINAEGTHGYYTSLGADSYGEKDIYMIKFKPKPKTLAVLKGKVTDTKNKPIASQIFVSKVASGKLNGLYNSNASSGKYLIVLQPGNSYRAIFKAEGYVSDTLIVNAQEFQGFNEVIKNIILKKTGEKLPDTLKITSKENIVIGKKDTVATNKEIDTKNTSLVTLVDTNGKQKEVRVQKTQNDTLKSALKAVAIDLSDSAKQVSHSAKHHFTKDCEIDFTDSVHILNFNFGYKKIDLTSRQYFALDSILKPVKKKIVGIKINTHTDNVGSVRYNMVLSQKRAQSIARHLQKTGFSKAKIVACFYGESKPLFENSFPDGTDNPDGRYRNRRAEIEFFLAEDK